MGKNTVPPGPHTFVGKIITFPGYFIKLCKSTYFIKLLRKDDNYENGYDR